MIFDRDGEGTKPSFRRISCILRLSQIPSRRFRLCELRSAAFLLSDTPHLSFMRIYRSSFTQTLPHPGMQQAQAGALYMQQQAVFSPRASSAMPFNPAHQMHQLAQPQFHRPPQLVPMETRQGVDNGEASLGMSGGGSARASAEERGGGGGDREPPPPSSLQKVS